MVRLHAEPLLYGQYSAVREESGTETSWTGLYTGLLDWTIYWTAGLDYRTGLLDWTAGLDDILDCWTGLLKWTTGPVWTTCSHIYLPPPAYCTIIKTMVGNLGWPDCCDSFQVNLCMGSTNSLDVMSRTLVAVSRIQSYSHCSNGTK